MEARTHPCVEHHDGGGEQSGVDYTDHAHERHREQHGPYPEVICQQLSSLAGASQISIEFEKLRKEVREELSKGFTEIIDSITSERSNRDSTVKEVSQSEIVVRRPLTSAGSERLDLLPSQGESEAKYDPMSQLDEKVAGMSNKVDDLYALVRREWSLSSQMSKQKRWCSGRCSWQDIKVDHVSMMLIVLNVAFLGVEADIMLRTAGQGLPPPSWLDYCNTGFTVVFSLELLYKLFTQKCGFFKDPEQRSWNILDSMLVICALLDLLISFWNLTYLRAFRILRTIRAARALRVIGFIESLRTMVASISCAMPTLFWSLVLLALMLYSFTLVVSSGVEGYLRANGVDHQDEEVVGSFGSLGRALLSLFESISGGQDWAKSAAMLARVHWVCLPLFSVFVGFMSFAIMGVLTATIVNSIGSNLLSFDTDLVIDQRIKEDECVRAHLEILYRQVDTDGDGAVSKDQMKKAFQIKTTGAYLKSIGVSVDHTDHIFEIMDKNSNGSVSKEEFIAELTRHRGGATTVLDTSKRLSDQFAKLELKQKELLSMIESISMPAKREYSL